VYNTGILTQTTLPAEAVEAVQAAEIQGMVNK